MAVRSYLDQQIQNEAAARAAGAPVTRGSFTDIANREVGSGFVDRALGTIPANTPPPAPAFQQTFLNGLLAQLQSATPEQQQQVARFAPQIQGLLGPVLQQESGRDEPDEYRINDDGTYSPVMGGYSTDYSPSQGAAAYGTDWGPVKGWTRDQVLKEMAHRKDRALPEGLQKALGLVGSGAGILMGGLDPKSILSAIGGNYVGNKMKGMLPTGRDAMLMQRLGELNPAFNKDAGAFTVSPQNIANPESDRFDDAMTISGPVGVPGDIDYDERFG